MISFDKISASYDGVTQAVEDVSFTVEEPAIIGIIGPNGAGKSTFIKAALHLMEGSGSTTVDGQPLEKRKKEVAYVEQKNDIDYSFPITVGECVRWACIQKSVFTNELPKRTGKK